LQYLKDNLWGTQLLKDAQVLLDRLKRDRSAAR
jgi:hypothetical protein